MKNKSPSNNEKERIIEEFQKLLEERGRKPLEMARKAILEEEIESKKVKEALHYFMTKYWHDLARPTLLSICCEAVGGDPNSTVPFAVPLSLISGAIDIHDDIIDQSKTKYGRTTVYGKFGKEIALLTADALLFKGFTLLHKAYTQISKSKATKIMSTIKNLFYELGDAEAMELRLRKKLDVTPGEYLYIIEKKAADVKAHAVVGALLGDATTEETRKLAKYGSSLGKIIILYDDWMDLIYFEEIRHRLHREHLPLPLLYALQNSKYKYKISSILQKKPFTKRNWEELLDIVINNTRSIKLQKELMDNIVKGTINSLKGIRKTDNLILFIQAFQLDEMEDFKPTRA